MRTICLASQSPRRAELLQQIGVPFYQQSADIDETAKNNEAGVDYVKRLALNKAKAISVDKPGEIVLGADTIVVAKGRLLGKPINQQQALETLRCLSGDWHEVLTAVAIGEGEQWQCEHQTTRVRFMTLSEEQILAYWRSGEPQGKAGAYAIQGRGAVMVERIEGCYSNVVGLPLSLTATLLSRCGIPVWQTEA